MSASNRNSSLSNPTTTSTNQPAPIPDPYFIKRSDFTYDRGKLLGSGTFAYVFEGTYRNQKVAVKIQRTDSVIDNKYADFTKEFKKECEILKKIADAAAVQPRHPYADFILPFHAYTIVKGVHYFIFDLADGGTLEKFIEKDKASLPISWTSMSQSFALGITKGLNWLHTYAKIFHRDLKSPNILLKKAPYDAVGYIPLICDFGLSDFIGSLPIQINKGSALFSPHEVISHMGPITEETDVYNLGGIIYELLTERPIYKAPRFNIVIVFGSSFAAPLISQMSYNELIIKVSDKDKEVTAFWLDEDHRNCIEEQTIDFARIASLIPSYDPQKRTFITDEKLVKLIIESFSDCYYWKDTVTTYRELTDKVIAKRQRPGLPENGDPTLQKIVKQCFRHEQSQRPTTNKIIAVLEKKMSIVQNNSSVTITPPKIKNEYYIDNSDSESSSDSENSSLHNAASPTSTSSPAPTSISSSSSSSSSSSTSTSSSSTIVMNKHRKKLATLDSDSDHSSDSVICSSSDSAAPSTFVSSCPAFFSANREKAPVNVMGPLSKSYKV